MNLRSGKSGRLPRFIRLAAVAGLIVTALCVSTAFAGGPPTNEHFAAAASLQTATPIKHLVVVFQENETFDHYFGTYPHALNRPGETPFHAAPGTPTVNGLTPNLLAHNPNLHQPFRLQPLQAFICTMNHMYSAEQRAENAGRMDKFVQYTQLGGGSVLCPTGSVMSYYDGNTTTALWNYAQQFVVNDNSFSTTFGSSAVGAVNLAAATTSGVQCLTPKSANAGSEFVYAPPSASLRACSVGDRRARPGPGSLVYDAFPALDTCTAPDQGSPRIVIQGKTIGDLLSSRGVTWGWFTGGFDKVCNAGHPVTSWINYLLAHHDTHDSRAVLNQKLRFPNYFPYHEPFQFYPQDANPLHLRPSSTSKIGATDRANHQYDLTDFWRAASAGRLPAVSFLKPPGYQDGHPGHSDVLDEQTFLVQTINRLQQLPSWSSTAVVIAWDDSDGWYDHVRAPIVNQSHTPLDFGCGASNTGQPARCGYGQRLPFLVISPYARRNVVDHTLTDQTSILKFIEDNWLAGQRLGVTTFDGRAGSITQMFDFSHLRSGRVILNPVTGTVVNR